MGEFPEYDYLRIAQSVGRSDLTLSRPERRNALTHAMMEEIGDAVGQIGQDSSVRVLILRGAGGHFCAGGDIGFMAEMPPPPPPGEPDPLVAPYRYLGDVLLALNNLPQAVVAVVEGSAVGGGLGMACCADVVIVHKDVKMGMPEPRTGFIPSQIIPFVVRRMGEGRARQMAVMGTLLNGPEAVAAGIAHYCCNTGEEIEARLEEVLGGIRKCEPGAVAAVKRLVLRSATASDEAVLDDAAETLISLLRRPEAEEGMAAFAAKRPPSWAKG